MMCLRLRHDHGHQRRSRRDAMTEIGWQAVLAGAALFGIPAAAIVMLFAGLRAARAARQLTADHARLERSEEHTSELQSLMRNSYAVFCLKHKTQHIHVNDN